MKKLISAVLCLGMILSVASCGTAKETASGTYRETSVATTAKTESTTKEGYAPDFRFKTTDREGNEWDESVFASYDLVMINIWEPWCGPCVKEMPDIAKLYENYKDKNVLIIGVYSDTSMEETVDQLIKDSHVTYPVFHYSQEFDRFQTGYVPTTVFFDREGHVMKAPDGEHYVIGSKSYEQWAAIIDSLLG